MGFDGYKLLNSSEAAKLLAISAAHLLQLSTHGEISYVNVGVGKREIRRYRESDIQRFVDNRTLISPMRHSTRAPLEITDEDLFKAAKIVARDRKRRQWQLADAAISAKRTQEREAREAWLKKCEKEADAIRYRLFLEGIYGKGKVPPERLNTLNLEGAKK